MTVKPDDDLETVVSKVAPHLQERVKELLMAEKMLSAHHDKNLYYCYECPTCGQPVWKRLEDGKPCCVCEEVVS